MPAQAGIQSRGLDSRVRENDGVDARAAWRDPARRGYL